MGVSRVDHLHTHTTTHVSNVYIYIHIRQFYRYDTHFHLQYLSLSVFVVGVWHSSLDFVPRSPATEEELTRWIGKLQQLPLELQQLTAERPDGQVRDRPGQEP